MLSRNAQGVYWLGRYLERADLLCRMMKEQVGALVDRPVEEINFAWRRLFACMQYTPAGGLFNVASDNFTQADSFTLAGETTFEEGNPNSLTACIRMGRENARQMRNCISAEMWTSLNLSYLKFLDSDIVSIWRRSPEAFFDETSRDLRSFFGIAHATMYRDEAWLFLQLGRAVERAQGSVSLLLAQVAEETKLETGLEYGLESLLAIFEARETYRRRFGFDVASERVRELLVTDPRLPNSIRQSTDAAFENLNKMGPAPDGDFEMPLRIAGRTCSLVRYEWPDVDDRRKLLKEISEGTRQIHASVEKGFFHNSN
ncbi:MAG: alpha-E domain-containing protein [Albidovulum sp.]|nr:alpha-E domain-containing protein [Albidovulum sp.]MDE0531322.1 alpha-E domain-containing protein [Albidovulum sp.]